EHLAQLLEQTRIDLILTQRNLAEHLPEGRQTICLDNDTDWAGDTLPDKNPISPTAAANLAFVTCTAGTTGLFRIMTQSHKALADQVHRQRRHIPPLLAGKTLLHSPASSHCELFATWCAGATLVLAKDTRWKDTNALWR